MIAKKNSRQYNSHNMNSVPATIKIATYSHNPEQVIPNFAAAAKSPVSSVRASLDLQQQLLWSFSPGDRLSSPLVPVRPQEEPRVGGKS